MGTRDAARRGQPRVLSCTVRILLCYVMLREKRVYKSAGIGLGRWVARQRSVYQGTLKGRLSASQVARLEELMGSAWNPSAEEWVDRMMCSAP